MQVIVSGAEPCSGADDIVIGEIAVTGRGYAARPVSRKRLTAWLHLFPRRTRQRRAASTPLNGIAVLPQRGSYQEAVDALGRMHHALVGSLGFEPLCIGFWWPPGGGREAERCRSAAFLLFLDRATRFVAEFERDCVATSFCIAQGDGATLLLEGLRQVVALPGHRPGRRTFDETVLLEPGCPLRHFAHGERGECIARLSRRVHVYLDDRHDRSRCEDDTPGMPENLVQVRLHGPRRDARADGILRDSRLQFDLGMVLRRVHRDEIRHRVAAGARTVTLGAPR